MNRKYTDYDSLSCSLIVSSKYNIISFAVKACF